MKHFLKFSMLVVILITELSAASQIPPPPPPPAEDQGNGNEVISIKGEKPSMSDSENKEETIYIKAERMPVFPGECEDVENPIDQAKCTESAIIQHVVKNVIYPDDARARGIYGRVFIEFVVGVQGEIKSAKVIKGVHESIDTAALNAVKTLPVMTPALQRGEFVNLKYTIPVNFKLSENKPILRGLCIDPSGQISSTVKNLYGLTDQLPLLSNSSCETNLSKFYQAECLEKELLEYISNELSYPKNAKKEKKTGTVIVKVIITENGTMEAPSLFHGVHRELDLEAIRIIKSLPVFSPAKENGESVKFTLYIPVNFSLKK